jgi:hypothetical protein
MRFLRRRNRQAAPAIGEAEAYARLHGERGEEILRVEPMPPPPPPVQAHAQAKSRTNGITGETLRRAFERRLQSREDPPRS